MPGRKRLSQGAATARNTRAAMRGLFLILYRRRVSFFGLRLRPDELASSLMTQSAQQSNVLDNQINKSNFVLTCY